MEFPEWHCFFPAATYNAQKKKFTLKPAARTRYVHITQQSPGGKIRKGSIVKQAKWLDLVRQEGGDSAVLIYVHGFNTSQKDMLDRLGKIEGNLRANGYQGAVVAFDWPSDGSVHTYDSDRSDAKAVAPHLVGDGYCRCWECPRAQDSPDCAFHGCAGHTSRFLGLRDSQGQATRYGRRIRSCSRRVISIQSGWKRAHGAIWF